MSKIYLSYHFGFSFTLHHPSKNFMVFCSRVISGLLVSCLQYLLYIWEWEWCFDCIMPRQYWLLGIDCGTTCRLLAIAWHVLPNVTPDLLSDISLYGSLVFPYIPISWIVLSILNTRQPHHCLEAFASGFMFSCVPLSLDPTMVDFFSPFSLHKEAFLTTPHLQGHSSLQKLSIPSGIFIAFIIIWIYLGCFSCI